MAYPCNPSTWEVVAGGSEIQGHVWLGSESGARLCYERPCRKREGRERRKERSHGKAERTLSKSTSSQTASDSHLTQEALPQARNASGHGQGPGPHPQPWERKTERWRQLIPQYKSLCVLCAIWRRSGKKKTSAGLNRMLNDTVDRRFGATASYLRLVINSLGAGTGPYIHF